jgi:hypothetical protein
MAGRGSKPGERRGGRQKGTPNRRTVELARIADKAASKGITPLEVMLEAMRDLHTKGELVAASGIAKDAAPYMHPRLSQVEQHLEAEVSQRVVSAEPMSDEEWEARYGAN